MPEKRFCSIAKEKPWQVSETCQVKTAVLLNEAVLKLRFRYCELQAQAKQEATEAKRSSTKQSKC
jgi:hypothetical protein